MTADIAGSAGAPVPTFAELFIAGEWLAPSSSTLVAVRSPATGAELAFVAEAQAPDVDVAVERARVAFDEGTWPGTPPVQRAEALRRVAMAIRDRADLMATSFSAEIGLPIGQAIQWVEGAALMWEDAAALAERFAFEEPVEVTSGDALIRHEPVGVVAAITPWNNPAGNPSLKIAPALAAGCCVVSKPAPEGAATSLMLAQAIDDAALPAGTVSVIPGGREAGEHLVRHPSVDKVTFTGSAEAGRRIMAACAERITRVTLELGGKSAAIIADDVDLDAVVPEIVASAISHSGQICAALTRVLVPRALHDEIAERMAREMDKWRVGDPSDPSTRLGPLVAERQLQRVEEYVAIGIQEGARLVRGGTRSIGAGDGWYFEPTLFADADNAMRVSREEIFGPVVVMIPFDTIEEAIEIANDSPYGLSGAVYSADLEVAERVADKVRAGQMWINTWGMSVAAPFGGFKQSGLGREGGAEGLGAYLESKYLQRASQR